MNTIDKINYYLAKQGKNGAGLCAYLGVSNGVYSQWNTGRTSPRKSKLPLIAEYLGVTVEDLLPDESIKKQPSIPKDEELNKNDAVWDLREAVLERFPDYDVGQLSEIMDFIEGRLTQAQKIALDIEKQQQTKPLVSLDASQRSAVRSLLQELLQEDGQ